MNDHRLVGVTTPQTADRLISAGASLAGSALRVIRHPGLAALLVKAPVRGFFAKRTDVLGDMVLFQKQLEAALPAGPILPGAFANPLIDEAEALRALAIGQNRMQEALAFFTGVRQYQITIAWNPAIALAHCSTREDFKAALAGVGEDATKRAEAIRTYMERVRAEIGAAALKRISAPLIDKALEPIGEETMLLNMVGLISQAREPEFDAALEDVDASFPDLAIKQIGPLPPVSFAAIRIEQPKAREISEARLLLGRTVEGLDALKDAYRAQMKTVHPDVAFASGDKAERLTKAYKLLQRVEEAKAAGADGAKPLLVDLVAASGERWAA